MSTWGSLRFQLQKGAPGIDLDLLDSYLNSRYEQVLEKAEWSGVKQHFTLLTQAAYQSATDTVTATVGSPLIVGLGANFTSQLIGSRFYIPGDAVYYTVSAVADTLDLTLERPYEGRGTDPPGTVYAASPYVFMQHIYLLATDVGTVISLLDPVTGFPLLAMSKAELDASAGPRTLVNDPTSYAMYDDSSETTPPVLHQIELFPPPLYARGIPVEYKHVAAGFDGGSTSTAPFPWVSDTVLLEGCRADIAMYRAGQNPESASAFIAIAKGHEAKYQEALASALRVEYQQRRIKTPVKMAERFTRHRLSRAGRGLNNYWGPGQGGPN